MHRSTRNENPQGGFSLIELLLALVVTLVVVGLAVVFARAGLPRIGAMAESRERNARVKNLSERLRADIESAGLNLVQLSTEGAGVEAVAFEPCCGYDTSTPGALTNVSGGPAAPPVDSTRALGSGAGFLSFSIPAPTRGAVGFSDASGAVSSISIDTSSPALRTWAVFEDNAFVPTPMSEPGQAYALYESGDSFDIEIANRPDGTRSVDYYIVRAGARRLAYQSVGRQPAYPVRVTAQIGNEGGSFNYVLLNGAPIVDRTVRPSKVAPMPRLVGGSRPALPIFVDTASGAGTSLVMLRGDVAADPARLARDFDARELHGGRSAILHAGVPARGRFGESADRLLLVDYAAGRSLLLFADADVAPAGGELPLPVVAVQGQGAPLGWGLFQSDEADLDHVFPAGSVVVQLDDPVEYRWDGQDTLFRRVGDQAWSVVAAGVTEFGLQEMAGAASYDVRVTARMLSDTAFTSADRGDAAPSFFDATFAPRSLNSTYRR